MSALRAEKVEAWVAALLLTSAGARFCTHISPCSNSCQVTWWYQNSSFGSQRKRQALEDNAVNGHTARHWLQKVRSEDLALSDEPRNSCP